MRKNATWIPLLLAVAVLGAGSLGLTEAGKKDKKKKQAKGDDPYAEYVWPPPPDKARIKLEAIIAGRADVETRSKFKRKLLVGTPQSAYDFLKKPHAVAFDPQGRILVTDSQAAALIRFDREGRIMDVFGTKGPVTLELPLGLDVGPDGTAYVADGSARRVVAYDAEGGVAAVYGGVEELENPTDCALSPDGKRLYVADSRGHRIVVFDTASADVVDRFGESGEEPGQFHFPTSLTFGPEGDLFVVDQLNCRVQLFEQDGEHVDTIGEQGDGPGAFTRPKDVAVDEIGLIYVVDNAFNNVQIFDADFTLLTFVGSFGYGPGQFRGAAGVAVRGDEIAVVDQMGARLQLFRFIAPREE